MPITFDSSNSVYSTTGQAYTATSSDSIILSDTGHLISTVNDALVLGGTGQNYNLNIGGTIATYALGYAGIYMGSPNTVDIRLNYGGNIYAYGAGLYLWGAANVYNAGSIVTSSSRFAAVHFEETSGDYTINNSGLISGASGDAIRLSGSGVHTIDNSGVVQSFPNYHAILSTHASGTDNVTNTGVLRGNVDLGGGNDTLDTTHGRVLFDVRMGAGTDTFHGSNFIDTVYGGADTDRLNGAGAVDYLYGEGGADILDGGAGADQLTGGSENDTYIVDHRLDVIVETAGGGTLDIVRAKVSFTLAADDNIEQLQTFDPAGTAAINLTGNGLAQGIQGNAGANRLSGAGGNDVLAGGRGNDVLTGGANDDSFLFNTALNARLNVDRITDFSAPRDTIVLENSLAGTFRALANGFLTEAAFEANDTGTATGASDRIIYNTRTGALSYDANGSSAGGAVQFAVLSTKPAISHADFFVI